MLDYIFMMYFNEKHLLYNIFSTTKSVKEIAKFLLFLTLYLDENSYVKNWEECLTRHTVPKTVEVMQQLTNKRLGCTIALMCIIQHFPFSFNVKSSSGLAVLLLSTLVYPVE